MMDSFDKWAKVLLTILVIALIWVIVILTITSFHAMKNVRCPNCGAYITDGGEE